MRPPLRIAVLECDEPMGRVKDKYNTYGTMFRQLLEAGAKQLAEKDHGVGPELDITHFDVVNTEQYPKMEDIDAVLLTGSKYNSFDNDPWILKLVDFTKDVLAQDRVRVIGVCFGHQIVGRAMGVQVGRNDDGWEISVFNVQLTDKGKELFCLEEMNIFQMHRDIVYEYPAGVEKLGHTPRCSVQSMYVKNKLITVQGHPEFNDFIVSEITQRRYDQGVFEKAVYEDAMSRVHKHHDGVAIAAAFLRFLLEE